MPTSLKGADTKVILRIMRYNNERRSAILTAVTPLLNDTLLCNNNNIIIVFIEYTN